MTAVTTAPGHLVSGDVSLALTDITLDADLQPRARIDDDTFEDYRNAIADGALFPPVVVFDDGVNYLLADGYHRWHAHRALELTSIRATVFQGSRQDALRHALGANFNHGKRREPGDFRRAYERAVAHGLVGPTDALGLQHLLNCTPQWAYRLTEQARAEADRARDANIAQRKAAGQSIRSIARELGVPKSTVQDAAVRKINALETGHPLIAPRDLVVSESTTGNTLGAQNINPLVSTHSPTPLSKHPAQVEFDDMVSPRGRKWRAAFDVLLALNLVAPPDDLFADRYTRFDDAFGTELTKAHAWINAMQRRFF